MPEPSGAPDPVAVLASIAWTATGFTPITSGWDNFIWRFTTADGHRHALRLYRSADDAAALLRRADHEAAGLAVGVAAGLPVPATEARGVFNGAPFFVQSWLPGVPLLDAMKSQIWRLNRLASDFGRFQARIHRIPAPPDLRRYDADWIAANVKLPALAAALQREAVADTFCHLDYHPLNVLAMNARISGIVDFSNAAVSDRRADLAFTQVALLHIPIPPGPLRPALQQLRRLVHRGWKRGYMAEAGSFPLTPLFQAAALERFLVDLKEAVRDGRGWGTAADIARLTKLRDERLRAAGVSVHQRDEG